MFLLNMGSVFSQSANIAKFMNGTNFSGNIGSNYIGRDNPGCHFCGTSDNGACHVMVGAGDTPLSADAYDMVDTSIIASDKLRSLRQGATYTMVSGTTITTQWRNESASPITVKEVGLAYKYAGGSYDKTINILLSHKVLDTPVTIQPGETYTFAYNIKV